MKAILAALAALLLAFGIAHAGPNDVLYHGNYYREADVVMVIGDKVRISSLDGNAEIPWAVLPSALKRKYADDYAMEQARIKARAAVQSGNAMETKFMRVEVVQVLPKGALVDQLRGGHTSSLGRIGLGGPSGVSYSLSGKVSYVQGLAGDVTDGKRFLVQAYRDGTYSYMDTLGAQRTIEKWVFVSLVKDE